MKKYFFFIFFLLIVLGGFGNRVMATDCISGADGYCTLTPLPIVTDSAGKVNINTFIPGVVKLIIGLAGALAVLRIMMGGIKYMTSEAFGGKLDAKDTINDALIGLLLILSAYIILATLNPRLVNFDFSIEGLKLGTPIGTNLGTSTPAGGGGVGPSYGKIWGNDSIDRTSLTNLGIAINHFNCAKIGDSRCTSVLDIGPRAIAGLETLKKNCGCNVLVTGGTEYWLHGNRSTEENTNNTQHKPGLNTVDLSLNTSVTSFLRTKGTKTSGGGCSVGSEAYTFGRGIYVNEVIEGNDPHWHVCY